MKRDESIFLEDILASIAKVERYTHRLTQDTFVSSNTEIQDAVL